MVVPENDTVIVTGTSGIGKTSMVRSMGDESIVQYFNDFSYLREVLPLFPGGWQYVNRKGKSRHIRGFIYSSKFEQHPEWFAISRFLMDYNPDVYNELRNFINFLKDREHFIVHKQEIVTETYRRLGKVVAEAPFDGKLKVVEIAAAEGKRLAVDVSSKTEFHNFLGEHGDEIQKRLIAVLHLDGTLETKEQIKNSILLRNQEVRPETIQEGMGVDTFYQVRGIFPESMVYDLINEYSATSSLDKSLGVFAHAVMSNYYFPKFGLDLRTAYENLGLRERYQRFNERQLPALLEGQSVKIDHDPRRRK